MFKSPKLILIIILLAFFFRGIFVVTAFPIFRGQDESRHYNTVQYLANNKKTDCQNVKETEEGKEIYKENAQNKQDISTYRYSDEIRQASLMSQTQRVRGEAYNKIGFAERLTGKGEEKFKEKLHSKEQHICPPDIASSSFNKDQIGLYHKMLSPVERPLSTSNIFIRYYILRMVSVIFGMILLGLAYYIFRVVNFSAKQSLLLTAIVSFQPKLSIYFTNINYDVLLIPLWTGVILVSSLILKKGWNIIRASFLVLLTIGAIMTKPTALPLVGLVLFLAGMAIYKKIKKKQINWLVISLLSLATVVMGYLLLKKAGMTVLFTGKYLGSIGEYLSKSLPKIYGSSRDYWGAIGWRNNNLTLAYVKAIWLLEYISWAGLIFWVSDSFFERAMKIIKFDFSACPIFKSGCVLGKKILLIKTAIQKRHQLINTKKNKNQKIYFWFMLASIIALQAGVRIADWKVFASSGSLSLGTPGRYWLPNIVPHFILLALGLKVVSTSFVRSTRLQKKYFEFTLAGFLILMILYWTYEVVDIIIPRFYL